MNPPPGPDAGLHRIFVYGTLKRGGENHHHLAGQHHVGGARTRPGYRLYRLCGYPGMVADASDGQGVLGEVWDVDSATLLALDAFEGVGEGLYERVLVPLQAPFDQQDITAYVYLRGIEGCEDLGGEWRVE